jgi:hypothetical protein
VDDPALGTEVFKFVEQYKMEYPVYMRERLPKDETVQEWYETVDAIPMTYVFKNGKLHNTLLGGVDNQKELVEAIDGVSLEETFAGTDEEEEWDEQGEDYTVEEE